MTVSTTRMIMLSSSVRMATPTNNHVHPVHVTPDTTTTATVPTTTTATSVMSTSSITELEFHTDMVTTVLDMDTVTMVDMVMATMLDLSMVAVMAINTKTMLDMERVMTLDTIRPIRVLVELKYFISVIMSTFRRLSPICHEQPKTHNLYFGVFSY